MNAISRRPQTEEPSYSAWVTAAERTALEQYVVEVSGPWAAIMYELGGPTPPLTFDEGVYLLTAASGPVRADGTVAVLMPLSELRERLARIREDLVQKDEERYAQVEDICGRLLGTEDLPRQGP